MLPGLRYYILQALVYVGLALRLCNMFVVFLVCSKHQKLLMEQQSTAFCGALGFLQIIVLSPLRLREWFELHDLASSGIFYDMQMSSLAASQHLGSIFRLDQFSRGYCMSLSVRIEIRSQLFD